MWPWSPPSLTSHTSGEALHVSVAAPAIEKNPTTDNRGIIGVHEVRWMCGYRSRASSDSSACFDGKHTDRSDWEVELLETVPLRYEIPRHKLPE